MPNFNDEISHFKKYCNAECNPVTNNSSIPAGLMYKTNLRLSSISFTDQDIPKIIKSLNGKSPSIWYKNA